MVFKKGITHQLANHLSRLINGEAPVGIPDDLLDAYLFNVEMVPKWSKDIVSMLTIGSLYLYTSKEANLAFIEQYQIYAMVTSRLYRKEDWGIFSWNCA